MKSPVFKGLCTAMITPFSRNGLDLERMGELIDFQIKNGTDALLFAGTTGENATLEIHEFNTLVDFCITKTAGRAKTIVGIGGNNTAACCKKAQHAEKCGADAVLITPPYYNKSSVSGLIEHFTSIADNSALPLILYNVPSRTAIGIPLKAYISLSTHPNINGIKESSGNLTLLSETITNCRDNLNIWCGNDDNALAFFAMGARGLISVASNIIPDRLSKLCNLCLDGKFSNAYDIFFENAELISLLFSEPNPIPLKKAMELMGLDSGLLRLPLIELSENNAAKLSSCLSKLGLLK